MKPLLTGRSCGRLLWAQWLGLQEHHIREFLREGVDLLIVSANEAEPITPVVEEAYNRGIPVVILDRRITSQQHTAYVGGNNQEVGHIAGHYASSLLHQRGNVLEILGLAGASPALDRHRGFGQVLAASPGGRIVAQVSIFQRPCSRLAATSTCLFRSRRLT